MNKKDILGLAIKHCLEAREEAILIKMSSTKVGACIYTRNNFYEGYNIQNRSHKSYHAEEVACLNFLLQGGYTKEARGIIVSFSANDIKKLTFCCGHCRQIMWETFKNPDFLITEVDIKGNVIMSKTLGELYQFPYPQ